MNNLKIGTRLGLAFGSMLLLIAIVAVVPYFQTAKIVEQVEQLTNSNNPKIIATFQVQRSLLNILRSVSLVVGIEDDSLRGKEQSYIEAQQKEYLDNLGTLGKLETSEQGKALLEKLKSTVRNMQEVNGQAVGFATSGNRPNADNVLKMELPPLIAALASVTEEMILFQKQRAAERSQEASKAFHATQVVMPIVLIVATIAALALAMLITRSITRPLCTMRDMLQDIAQGEGDLTKRLDTGSKDELGEVTWWFNSFIEKLHGVIGKIAESSRRVASASSQLNDTAVQIATGAEEGAAQTGAVATASEQMAATSCGISQNCQFAADGSQQAHQAALAGARVVKETISVMENIAEKVKISACTVAGLGSSVEQIGEIVGTIEDIADQTNLLALNAAIEAARAGEQGRGFAVVADEVRALADRTTKATREIGGMIRAIQQGTREAVEAMDGGVKEVAMGTEKAAQSGEALEQILEQINSVTSQIHQVATAAEEQTATTAEMSENMQEITEVVYASSRGATETAAASSELTRESQQLQSLVGQFKL